MHHYPFHVGDYASHTQHLDELEDLAYRRMLDYVYLNEINLPESIEEVARLIRMRTQCERIATVLREFFTLENGEWINKRASLEIGKYHDKSDKAKDSASKRWKKDHANALPTHSERIANASKTHNGRNANQNQNQNQNQKKESSKDLVIANAQPNTKTGTRLPNDWQLSRALGEWAITQGLTANQVRTESEKFKDYWHGVAGAKGRKADWSATWRNWIRKASFDTAKQPTGFIDTHTDRSWADE